jgi:hypothetical protein
MGDRCAAPRIQNRTRTASLLVLVLAPLLQGCGESLVSAPAPIESDPPVSHYASAAKAAGLLDTPRGWGRGATWVDYDLDGWEDLWISDGASGVKDNPNRSRLMKNRRDGSFEPYDLPIPTSAMLINWAGVWGDYDEDGDPDLFLVNGAAENVLCTLFRNDVPSGGSFTEVTAEAGILPTAAQWWGGSWADIDNDGHLDLVVTARLDEGATMSAPTVVSGDGVTQLYHNEGNGHFVERSAELGLFPLAGNVRNPVWFDYDRDGDPDLFIAGMDAERLYRNDGPKGFVDVTPTVLAPLGLQSFSWTAAAADFDQDGWEDLYLGRWDRQDYILHNQHDGTFHALGTEVGLDMLVFPVTRENTMGLGIGDVDDNGFPDILLGTGRPEEAAMPVVFCNEGRPLHFRRCSEDFAPDNFARHHGIALADFDHDGDTDVLYSNGGIPDQAPLPYDYEMELPALFLQSTSRPPDTAALHLVGTVSNHDAIGAVIEVGAEPNKHYYTVHGTQAFQSQNSLVHTLFLGGAEAEVTVRWPSGRVSTTTLSRGDRVELTETP